MGMEGGKRAVFKISAKPAVALDSWLIEDKAIQLEGTVYANTWAPAGVEYT